MHVVAWTSPPRRILAAAFEEWADLSFHVFSGWYGAVLTWCWLSFAGMEAFVPSEDREAFHGFLVNNKATEAQLTPATARKQFPAAPLPPPPAPAPGLNFSGANTLPPPPPLPPPAF